MWVVVAIALAVGEATAPGLGHRPSMDIRYGVRSGPVDELADVAHIIMRKATSVADIERRV